MQNSIYLLCFLQFGEVTNAKKHIFTVFLAIWRGPIWRGPELIIKKKVIKLFVPEAQNLTNKGGGTFNNLRWRLYI